uniref:Uncharacterized protein n=1 Tax=Glossina palpalis gambiensis TaxID=67801 RepID=A0A1B0BC72_9MUSC
MIKPPTTAKSLVDLRLDKTSIKGVNTIDIDQLRAPNHSVKHAANYPTPATIRIVMLAYTSGIDTRPSQGRYIAMEQIKFLITKTRKAGVLLFILQHAMLGWLHCLTLLGYEWNLFELSEGKTPTKLRIFNGLGIARFLHNSCSELLLSVFTLQQLLSVCRSGGLMVL